MNREHHLFQSELSRIGRQGNRFDLWPNLIRNTKGSENYSNNPDKRHYFDSDIFTYISYANIQDNQRDTGGFISYPVSLHDTIYYSKGMLILDTVLVNPSTDKYHFTPQIRPLWPGSG